MHIPNARHHAGGFVSMFNLHNSENALTLWVVSNAVQERKRMKSFLLSIPPHI